MNNQNNGPRSALSPVSVAGSDWSGISRYQSTGSDREFYNNGNPGGGGPGMGMGGNPGLGLGGMGPPPRANTFNGSGGPQGPPGGFGQRPNGAPSPPSSVARSSDGAIIAESGYGSLSQLVGDEELHIHHQALKQLLAQELIHDEGNMKQKRARDKLFRLSKIQFQELSTDVYDELQRRQLVNMGRDTEQGSKTPSYLLPKESFHPKRNQARMKLSTLPVRRFRDLAKDVFYELERRYPQFSDNPNAAMEPPLSPTGSMSSMRGFPAPPGRVGNGSPGPGRMGSPGPGQLPNGPGRGYPPNNPPQGNLGVSNGPGNGPSGQPNQFGRPLPKTFQSNTIIPNKSTMVEEDDEDNTSDPYGYDEVDMNSQRGSSHGHPAVSRDRAESIQSKTGSISTMNMGGTGGSNESDKQTADFKEFKAQQEALQKADEANADYKSQIEALQKSVEDLEINLREKEAEVIRVRDENMAKESNLVQERNDWDQDKYELESRIASLESMNQQLQDDLAQAKEDALAQTRSLQSRLDEQEHQIDDLSNQLNNARAELDKAPVDDQRSGAQPTGDADYDRLLRDHENLKAELREQQEVTDEVRNEATIFLQQMKDMSERTAESYEREEQLQQQVMKLQDEVSEWKSRYARAKNQLRSIRTASMGLAPQGFSISQAAMDGGFTDANGLIKDVHITKFQIAIDDLLRQARSTDQASVLEFMKTVVVATRAIIKSVDDSSFKPLNGEDLIKLKNRVSSTANNLITASKNHASANGLSPVSLLDAAASHLTSSVVELVKVVKIKTSGPGDLEDLVEDEEPPSRAYSLASTDSAAAFGGHRQPDTTITSPDRNPAASERNTLTSPKYIPNNHRNTSPPAPRISTGSNYSNSSNVISPRQSTTSRGSRIMSSGNPGTPGNVNWGKRDGLSMMSPPRDLPKAGLDNTFKNGSVDELRLFVEQQFENIVGSIQALLTTVREDGDMEIMRNQVSDLVKVVGAVVEASQRSFNKQAGAGATPGSGMLRERGDWILNQLIECKAKMGEMHNQGDGVVGPAGKDYKGRLAGLAYDLAREIKELVKTVEDMDNDYRQHHSGMLPISAQDLMENDDLR